VRDEKVKSEKWKRSCVDCTTVYSFVNSLVRVGNGSCEGGLFAYAKNRLAGRRRTSAVTLPSHCVLFAIMQLATSTCNIIIWYLYYIKYIILYL